MNKYRQKLRDNNSRLIHKNDVDECLQHLTVAHEKLYHYLKGKNEVGLLTNILNSSYEIKKHLK